MDRIRPLALSLLVTALAGCASSNLVVTPDTAKLERTADSPPKIMATVGYFIPNQYRNAVVRSANGSASYYPYRDVEAAYRQMLSNVFARVVRVTSPDDFEAMAAAGIQYIIVPEMVTSSSASATLIVPASTFAVELTSNIRCPAGTLIANPQVVGQSSTDVYESFIDGGAAGRRAMGDALLKMQAALLETKFGGEAASDVCRRKPGPG
jgi:uncharacterized lipoprotein